MFKNKVCFGMLFCLTAPMFSASVTHASTLVQVVYPVTRPSAEVQLSDLLLNDKLGYDCIDEAQIDVAFFAVGKGARLPQTCLPEPCREAISKARLGTLIGRQPTIREWDEYFSRYSDTCRKETVAFDDADVLPQDPEGFWLPIVNPITPPFSEYLTGVGGSTATSGGGGGTTFVGGGGGGGGGGIPPAPPPGGGPEVGGDGDSGTTPEVVPLPAGLWLLLSGFAALGALVTRKRFRAA